MRAVHVSRGPEAGGHESAIKITCHGFSIDFTRSCWTRSADSVGIAPVRPLPDARVAMATHTLAWLCVLCTVLLVPVRVLSLEVTVEIGTTVSESGVTTLQRELQGLTAYGGLPNTTWIEGSGATIIGLALSSTQQFYLPDKVCSALCGALWGTTALTALPPDERGSRTAASQRSLVDDRRHRSPLCPARRHCQPQAYPPRRRIAAAAGCWRAASHLHRQHRAWARYSTTVHVLTQMQRAAARWVRRGMAVTAVCSLCHVFAALGPNCTHVSDDCVPTNATIWGIAAREFLKIMQQVYPAITRAHLLVRPAHTRVLIMG